MKLSIIIPHYNSPALLKVLLDSIGIHQDTQIVVVDDHSTKELETYFALSQDPLYSHVTFVSNDLGKKGAGSARNKGLDLSTGDFYLFCDADDYLVNGYRKVLEPYFECDYDVVYFTPISRYVDSQEDAHRADKFIDLIKAHMDHPTQKTEDAIRFTFYIPSSKLIKRDMVIQHHIRFDETMVSNDVMFSVMIGAEAQKIDVSLETIYCLTRSTGSLTMTRLEKNFDKRFEIGLNLHRYLREKLSTQRYAQLDLPALVFVLQAFQYHLGIKKALWVYKQLKQQHIPVFRLSLFNKRRLKQLKRK